MRNTKNSTRKRWNYTRIISTVIISIIIFVIFLMGACSKKAPKVEQAPDIQSVNNAAVSMQPLDFGLPGGQLQIYIPTGITSLDPLNVDSKEMMSALSFVYENFVKYDNENKLTPSIAESWELIDENAPAETPNISENPINLDNDIENIDNLDNIEKIIPQEPEPSILPTIAPENSDDFDNIENSEEIIASKLWKVSIRKDVFWQGTGDKVTSSDIVYTMGLLKTPKYQNSIYAHNIDEIVKVTTIDDNTIIIEAKSAGTAVLHALTFPVVSRKHFNLQKQPVGTGPYIMTFANANAGLEFAENTNWWKQPPYIKSIIAYTQKDNLEAIEKIKDKTLNYIPTMAITASTYREIGKTNIIDLKTQQLETLLINHSNFMLQDVAVRRAIAYAIDKRDIISKAYLGNASATDVPVAPDSWLYNVGANSYDFNVATAKKMLADAGWKDIDRDGFLDKSENGIIKVLEFRLLVNDTPENQIRKDVANLIKAQLEEIGIKITIEFYAWTESESDFEAAIKAGTFDLALAGFNVSRSHDLSSFLSKEGVTNYSKYYNPEMEKLIINSNNSQTDKTLKDNFSKVQTLFVQDIPFVALYFRTSSVIYDESIVLTNDIRDTDQFYNVEKWYFTSPEREIFKFKSHNQQPNWSDFDKPELESTP